MMIDLQPLRPFIKNTANIYVNVMFSISFEKEEKLIYILFECFVLPISFPAEDEGCPAITPVQQTKAKTG